MSLQHCTLKCGGATKTLAAWGIESLTLQTSLGGADSLSFTCAEPIAGAPQFEALGEVEFFDPGGTRRFRGPVFPARDPWRINYQSPGGNYWLEGTPFQQEWNFLVDGTFTALDLSRAILCGGGRLVGAELGDAIDAAVEQGAPLSLKDNGLLEHRNPTDQQRDLNAMEVARRLLSWAPYLDYRFNYEGGDIEMEVLSILPTGHGFAGLPTSGESTRDVTLAADMERQPAPVFNPRFDLLISGMKIYFQGWQPHEITVEGSPVPVIAWTRETDEHTLDNGAFRKVELTLPLARGAWNGSEREADELPIAGLAKRMGAPSMRLWYDLSWTQKPCDFSIKPGMFARATDADPIYAGARAIVQSVTHTISKSGHSTSVVCGAPKQLGFYDPKLTSRLRNVPTDSGGQQFGFEPPKPDDEETNQLVTMAVHVKDGDDYVPTLVNVKGDPGAAAETQELKVFTAAGAPKTIEVIGRELDDATTITHLSWVDGVATFVTVIGTSVEAEDATRDLEVFVGGEPAVVQVIGFELVTTPSTVTWSAWDDSGLSPVSFEFTAIGKNTGGDEVEKTVTICAGSEPENFIVRGREPA